MEAASEAISLQHQHQLQPHSFASPFFFHIIDLSPVVFSPPIVFPSIATFTVELQNSTLTSCSFRAPPAEGNHPLLL